MPRPATGTVVEPKGLRKSWAIRFPVPGLPRQIISLGRSEDGWNRRRAEEALADAMAEVRLGIWKPSVPEPVVEPVTAEPTFLVFANQWFEAELHEWSERTIKDYKWALELHVLPFFAEYRLSEITIEVVDRFRTAKLKEGKLAPAQVNKCIKRVSQILEVAEEYDLVTKNTARGKKRKAKEPKIQKTWVEPEQTMALIEQSSSYMRPVVAALVGCGLRVGEAVALQWSDVNLATGTIKVGKAKTDAGSFRELDLPRAVVEELTEWKMHSRRLSAIWQADHRGESPVFLTELGGKVRRQSEANVSRRLKTSIKRANVKLAEQGIESISDRVTPHSLRRTYASLHAALGDDALYVSEQMGHKDVRFTLNVYSRAVKRRGKLSGAYLAEYDRALDWAKLPPAEKAQSGTETRIGDFVPAGLDSDSA